MATSIRTNNELLRKYTLKQWAQRLAVVGLSAEVLFVIALLVISQFTQVTLQLFITPLFGIFLALALLCISSLVEKISQEDEQERLAQQSSGTSSSKSARTVQRAVTLKSRHSGTRQLPPVSDGPVISQPPVYDPAPLLPPSPPPIQTSRVLNRRLTLPDTLRQDQQPFIVPLDGSNRDECDDKADYEGNRYVVTDGVAQSFMPAQWAKLIARHFVARQGDFVSEEDFANWLQMCSLAWEGWVRKEKLPVLEQEYSWMSWEEKVQQGAQTTLIGCSLFKAEKGAITVRVTAIGDAYFFLCRRTPPDLAAGEQWIEMYPPTSPDGENIPNTLKTVAAVMDDRAEARIRRSWVSLYRDVTYRAHLDDVILLVSDKLALWIWKQVQYNADWMKLLTIPNEQEFRTFVLEERTARRMTADDTTLFLIALNEQLYQKLLYEKQGTNPAPSSSH